MAVSTANKIRRESIIAGITGVSCVLFTYDSVDKDYNINFEHTFGCGLNITKEISGYVTLDQLDEMILSDEELKKYHDNFYYTREQKLKQKLKNGEINILKYQRLRKKITQYHLAKMLNVPQSNISKLERISSLKNVPFGKVQRISTALDIKLEDLQNV